MRAESAEEKGSEYAFLLTCVLPRGMEAEFEADFFCCAEVREFGICLLLQSDFEAKLEVETACARAKGGAESLEMGIGAARLPLAKQNSLTESSIFLKK